jgi:2-phosphosulfolactate phosphatase
VTNPYAQAGHQVTCDWGTAGAENLGLTATIVAVVDVLSFTTTLTVAADRGIEVYPYRWRDERAASFAASHEAVLAVGRSSVSPENPVSLSPATIRTAPPLSRLVLPSPNGSAIARRLAELGSTVIGVSLRNARAAAAWTAARLGADEVVAVIPAGERWDADDSLRPAAEDLWGAGAFVSALADAGVGTLSPEAELAAAAYRHVAGRLSEALRDCASGRELISYGFPEDVEIAAEADTSAAVPRLDGDSFRLA